MVVYSNLDESVYVNVGETIKVKILEVDHETCQLKLSIKDINYRTSARKRTKIEIQIFRWEVEA